MWTTAIQTCKAPLEARILFYQHLGLKASWEDLLYAYRSRLGQLPTLLERQMRAYKEGDAPKISDDLIKSIPILENTEVCVNLRMQACARISMLPEPSRPFESPEFSSGLPNACKMRQGVFLALKGMVEELDRLAPSFGYVSGQLEIKVFEALRDVETQSQLFEAKMSEIRQANPQMLEEDVEFATAKWVSPVKNNIPVHSTGAAVDIRLYDNKTRTFLDVGGFGVIWGASENAPSFYEELSTEQKANRLLCFIAATKAGLTNYVFEHWHYSLGDRYGAFWNGHACASYGPVRE